MSKKTIRLGFATNIDGVDCWQVMTTTYLFVVTGSVGAIGTVEARIPDQTDWVGILSVEVDSTGITIVPQADMLWPEIRITMGDDVGEAKINLVRVM